MQNKKLINYVMRFVKTAGDTALNKSVMSKILISTDTQLNKTSVFVVTLGEILQSLVLFQAHNHSSVKKAPQSTLATVS